jgi:N-acetylneuraminic acid mutarotase
VTPRLVAVVVAAAVLVAGLTASYAGSTEPQAGWERAASMSQRRSYIAAGELDGQIYAAGGMVGETGRPLATLARYDPRGDRWTVLEPLPVPTRAAAGAALDGRLYVVGGTTAAGNTSATWEYEPARGWRARAPLPGPRFNHSAVVLDGRLYVAGGFHRGQERREVFAFHPERNRWTVVARLPQPTHAFGLVAFGGELWFIGGRRGESVLREVWILDPERARWRRGPTLPRPMELLGAAVAGDEIHAVWESTYQVFDAGEGRWRDGPSPRVTRHALEAFAVDGVLYAVGGCTTALRDSPVVERLALE